MIHILWWLGIGYLILSALSGVALFFRAIFAEDPKEEEIGRDTLWGLFISCLVVGIIILGLSLFISMKVMK